MGALSTTGCTGLRTPFEPLVPDVLHISNTDRYRRPPGESEGEFTAFLLDELEATIEHAGPDTVAMVIVEPVQNSGGSLMPPAGYLPCVREQCDRHGILLCADEVITGFGRLGEWFASTRFGVDPDLITCAKGLSSAYAAIGALIAGERVMEPFRGEDAMYSHGMTFGGHPVQAAVALKNIEIMRREGVGEHVRATEGDFRAALEPLLELPSVGDLRGAGFFYALELVKDKETRARPSRRRNVTSCSGASCRRACSRAACSAGRTTAASRWCRSRRRSWRGRRSSTRSPGPWAPCSRRRATG
jgi:adenosylmethionine-8-amino-7-oxononanoate aminotransferase